MHLNKIDFKQKHQRQYEATIREILAQIAVVDTDTNEWFLKTSERKLHD